MSSIPIGRAALLVLHLTAGCAAVRGVVDQPREPRAWATLFRAQYGDRLAVRDLGPERRIGDQRAILLVPGMAITGDFFDLMAARLERDGFAPIIYEDPDLIATGVAVAAQRLAAEVAELLAATGAERIDIVAECTGGVVVRYYIEVLGGGAHVGHVVTFMSPHHGSVPAKLAAYVTGWQGLHDISRGSAVLELLDATPLPTEVSFTSIYSCFDSLLWPKQTPRIEGAFNVEFCTDFVDHFDGFWNPDIYARIIAAIIDDPTARDRY